MRQIFGKQGSIGRGEAKSEALSEASAIDLETLARVLAVQLGQYDTLELIKHLVSRVQ